jgi:hypothetical protein
MLFLFFLFIFDLLVRGSPHHYVSVWPFGFIYKTGRKPDSRDVYIYRVPSTLAVWVAVAVEDGVAHLVASCYGI